jgi:hypothetical protein
MEGQCRLGEKLFISLSSFGAASCRRCAAHILVYEMDLDGEIETYCMPPCDPLSIYCVCSTDIESLNMSQVGSSSPGAQSRRRRRTQHHQIGPLGSALSGLVRVVDLAETGCPSNIER